MERARLRFYAALALFAVWVVALGVLGLTSAEPPKPTSTASQVE